MALYERTIDDSVSVYDAITQERIIADSVSVNDSIIAQKIETLEISNARVLTPTKVRIDFSAPAVINSALQDPNSYTFNAVSAGAIDVIPQSVDLPPGQTNPSFVEVNVTEHTDGSIYSVEISSDIRGANGEVGGGPAKQYAGSGEPPTVILVLATNKNHVQVYFSETILNNTSANDINNYVWDNGLQTLEVESVIENVVTLKTNNQTEGDIYNLTVKGILSTILYDSIGTSDQISVSLL
jgi:hypothetical protein